MSLAVALEMHQLFCIENAEIGTRRELPWRKFSTTRIKKAGYD